MSKNDRGAAGRQSGKDSSQRCTSRPNSDIRRLGWNTLRPSRTNESSGSDVGTKQRRPPAEILTSAIHRFPSSSSGIRATERLLWSSLSGSCDTCLNIGHFLVEHPDLQVQAGTIADSEQAL
ncbi:Uncharacterised protein [Mycobacteroides abscessus subsp. abscessus]|nr:Uncharacterised protein [Mycobacteroides abscessus subsp. abscessus]